MNFSAGRSVRQFLMPNWKKLVVFALFMLIAFAGSTQSWAFSGKDAGLPKPPLYDLFSPYPFWLIWVVGGVLGEELVWRGYLLPGQEARYGRWAWLVNGMLWNVPFHLYTLSNSLSDLPFYLVLPFVVQRTGNTWVAVGVHALMASMAYVLILPGVFRG